MKKSKSFEDYDDEDEDEDEEDEEETPRKIKVPEKVRDVIRKPVKSSGKWELVEVPTQTAPAFKSPDGEVLNEVQLLLEIINRLDE